MNLDKFIKVMGMTTSPHDGEALVAIRTANAALAAINRTWEELLRGKIKVAAPSESPKPPSGRDDVLPHSDPAEIDPLFEAAFRGTSTSSSFYSFLLSVQEFWQDRGYLTDRQHDAVKRAAEKARR